MFDSIFVKNHRRAEWDQAVKEHMNFFKHADRDPTGTIAFDPSLTEPFILLSLLTVEALGVPHTLEESAFGFWCCLHEHDWLSEQGQTVFINDIPVEQLAKLRDLQRQKFYGMYKFLIENHIIKK